MDTKLFHVIVSTPKTQLIINKHIQPTVDGLFTASTVFKQFQASFTGNMHINNKDKINLLFDCVKDLCVGKWPNGRESAAGPKPL